MAAEVHKSQSSFSWRVLVPIALMLFSMFFGAGNLIFPPVLGAQAGTNFTPAIVGFLIGAVVLPVLSIIAVAISGLDVRSMVSRGGSVFSVAFATAVYLSIGAFFAIPRTGAVSFSTAIAPVVGNDSLALSAVFNAVFFVVSFWLALNPSGLVDKVGKVLTPALLVLLVLLVVVSMVTLDSRDFAPTEHYAHAPVVSGLTEGYFTMDSIAALAFGILVVSAIRRNASAADIPTVRATAISGIISGALLGVIYLGLGVMGSRIIDGQSYPDGAALLSAASLATLGQAGQIVFGGIVLLACLTTSIGLLAATSEFFHTLVPRVSYRLWLVVFSVVSFVIASLGLEVVFSVAVPIIVLLYPIAITIVTLTLGEAAVPTTKRAPLLWGFRLPVWITTIWSIITTINSDVLLWLPWQEAQFGWVLPALAAFVVGLVVDRMGINSHRQPAPAAS